MKLLDDGSVDLVIADPPFSIPARHYASRDSKWKGSIFDFALMGGYFKPIAEQIQRITKEKGRAFVFCDCTSYPVFFSVFYPHFHYVRAVIWHKGDSHFSLGTGQAFRYNYEMILHAFNRNSFFVKENRYDVITERVVPNQERHHPAEKPESIVKTIISACSSEKDTILDPFAGSFTTSKVAKDLKRNSISIEINPDYWENIGKKRLRYNQPSLDNSVSFEVIEL